jgi:hypothetical protein
MDPWFLDNRSKKSPALNLKDPAQAYFDQTRKPDNTEKIGGNP